MFSYKRLNIGSLFCTENPNVSLQQKLKKALRDSRNGGNQNKLTQQLIFSLMLCSETTFFLLVYSSIRKKNNIESEVSLRSNMFDNGVI